MIESKKLLAPLLLVALTACQAANGYGTDTAATGEGPGGSYEKVSELVDLPEFIPGMGTLYVQPDTLPAGPFLAYDRDGDHVSTVYMIPLDEIPWAVPSSTKTSAIGKPFRCKYIVPIDNVPRWTIPIYP